MKFNCHMNVEVCTTVKNVKYIFKYIHKGNDAAHNEIRLNYLSQDEILQHLDTRYRYVGPHQAVFRIMQYLFLHNFAEWGMQYDFSRLVQLSFC